MTGAVDFSVRANMQRLDTRYASSAGRMSRTVRGGYLGIHIGACGGSDAQGSIAPDLGLEIEKHHNLPGPWMGT